MTPPPEEMSSCEIVLTSSYGILKKNIILGCNDKDDIEIPSKLYIMVLDLTKTLGSFVIRNG